MKTNALGIGLLAVVLAGCSEDGTGVARSLELVTTGRLERGSELVLHVTEGGDTIPASRIQWSADPAGAVELLPAGRVRLLQAGQVTLTAQSDELSGALALNVAAPPMLVLDILRNGNHDIYMVALDGGDLRRLTTHTSVDESPTTAGNTIVFSTYRHGNAELYSYTLPNGPEARLTTTSTDEQHPAISPGGERLAFTRAAPGGVPRLYVAQTSNLAAAQLAATGVTGGFILEGSPAWASNETLIFTSAVRGSNDLFRVNAPPAAPTDLVVRPNPDVDASAAPDGRTILFAAPVADSSSDDLELHSVDLQTREVRVLLRRPGMDSRAIALTDGRIVFVALEPDPDRLYWFDPNDPTATLHLIPLGDGAVPGKIALVRN